MKNSLTKYFFAILIILIISFFGYHKFLKNEKINEASIEQSTESNNKEQETLNEAPIPVKVVKIKRGKLPLRLQVSAITDVKQKVLFKSEASGRIIEIKKQNGDNVIKGETIIIIDDREAKLALKEAEAQRLKALSKYLANSINISYKMSEKDKKILKEKQKKYEELLIKYKAGKISYIELRKVEDELLKFMIESGAIRDKIRRVIEGLTQAEINLEKARIRYEKTRVKAPFTGTISDIKVSLGEIVSPGTELFKLVNLNSLYLKAFVLETESSILNPGMRVRIKFLSFPGKVFYGKIRAISPELSEEEETLPVYITLRNPGYLRAGMRAEAEIEYKTLENVIKVPREAVIIRSERPLVFVVENNTAIWRYIEMGEQNSEEVEVKSGVDEGELVIVEGQLTLAHQSKVKIVE